MSAGFGPPRWLEALLGALLPRRIRDEITGDMREEWQARAEGASTLGLSLWLARQYAVVFLYHLLQALLGAAARSPRVLRRFVRRPGLVTVSTIAIAFGTAACVSVLAVAEAVFVRALPFPESERLGFLSYDFSGSDSDGFGLSLPAIESIRVEVDALETVIPILDWEAVDLAGPAGPVHVPASFVGTGYLELLGIEPALGRALSTGELASARARVVLLSGALWEDVFASDPGVIGRALDLNGVPFEVVGVLPPGAHDLRERLGTASGVVLPLLATKSLFGRELGEGVGYGPLNALVRLRPGIGFAQARSALLAWGERPSVPGTPEGDWTPRLESLAGIFHDDVRTPVAILLAGAALVFVLVTTNLSALFAVHGVGLRREAFVRRALGSSERAIGLIVVQEVAGIVLVGGALGVGGGVFSLAALDVPALLQLPAFTVPDVSPRVLGLTGVFLVLAGAFLAAAGTAPLFAAGPGRRRERAAGTAADGAARFRGLLIAAEVTVAFALLVGAGLMLRSLATLRATGYGFDAERLLTFSVDLRDDRWASEKALRGAAEEIASSMRALPDVEDAFLWSPNTIGEGTWVDLITAPGRATAPTAEQVEASRHHLLPGALRRAGIDLLRGRDFRAADGPDGTPVALVSASLAARLWPDEDPLGRRLASSSATAGADPVVVGVVADARHGTRISRPFGPQLDVYYPFRQRPEGRLSVALRLTPGAERDAVLTGARAVVAGLDPGLPVHGMRSMADRARAEEARTRLASIATAVYAALAAVLAALGIYGVVSKVVQDRRRELGVRVALGARPARLVADAVAGNAASVMSGLILGGLAALVWAHVASDALYGISPGDPTAFGTATVVMLALVAAAGLPPAIRASREPPAEALGVE